MRILYVITRAGQGGAQANVAAMLRLAKADGHEVHGASGDATGWLIDEARRCGVAFQALRSLGRSWNPLRNLALIFEIKALIRELRPDVVHFHSSNALVGALGAALARPRPKVVFTVHGWSVLHPGWRKSALVKAAYRAVMRRLLGLVDQVIYVDEADARLGEALGMTKPGQAMVAYNGLNPNLALLPRDEARSRLGLAPGDFAVGALARFVYPKNLAALVDAAGLVSSDCRVLLIGSGPLRAALAAQIAALGLAARVRLVDGLPEQTPYLTALDGFVLCSRFEGFPYVLLEAAWAGLPIIAAPVGGVPELIEDGRTGRIVEPQPAALAEAIGWLKAHPADAARLAAAAKAEVADRFLEGAMADKILAAYRRPARR